MWILVEVDEPHDVGNDEKNRYVLSDNLSIVDSLTTTSIVALGSKVHPATPSDTRLYINAIQKNTHPKEITQIIGVV